MKPYQGWREDRDVDSLAIAKGDAWSSLLSATFAKSCANCHDAATKDKKGQRARLRRRDAAAVIEITLVPIGRIVPATEIALVPIGPIVAVTEIALALT